SVGSAAAGDRRAVDSERSRGIAQVQRRGLEYGDGDLTAGFAGVLVLLALPDRLVALAAADHGDEVGALEPLALGEGGAGGSGGLVAADGLEAFRDCVGNPEFTQHLHGARPLEDGDL